MVCLKAQGHRYLSSDVASFDILRLVIDYLADLWELLQYYLSKALKPKAIPRNSRKEYIYHISYLDLTVFGEGIQRREYLGPIQKK